MGHRARLAGRTPKHFQQEHNAACTPATNMCHTEACSPVGRPGSQTTRSCSQPTAHRARPAGRAPKHFKPERDAAHKRTTNLCHTEACRAWRPSLAPKQPEPATNLWHAEPDRPAGLPNTSNMNAMLPTSLQPTCATQKRAEASGTCSQKLQPGRPAGLPNNPELQPTYGAPSPAGRPGSQTLQTGTRCRPQAHN